MCLLHHPSKEKKVKENKRKGKIKSEKKIKIVSINCSITIIEFSRDNSYSKYLEVHFNQVGHQAKYLVIQIQSDEAI